MSITLDTSVQEKLATEINAMMSVVPELEAAIEKHDFGSIKEHMQYCAYEIRKLMDKTRVH